MRRLSILGITLVTAFALAGCGADKPDRQAARDGLVKLMTEEQKGVDPAVIDEIATCLIDRVWDTAHEKTLNAWAEGREDTEEVSDNVVVATASRACNTEAKQRREDAEKKALGPMPTSAEVRSGLITALMKQSARPTRPQAEKIADCMLPQLEKKVSETTLRSWAKGSNEATAQDASAIQSVGRECGEKVING